MSRPRTGAITPVRTAAARRTASRDTQAAQSKEVAASDVSELGERPTAHPGDLKETVLPELRRLFSAGEFETLLPMAEALLVASPDAEVRSLVTICREKLTEIYATRLGRLSRVPVLKVPADEWMTLDLDHRACFLLVHVDGVSSFTMILDGSGMPRHEALRVLADLVARGILTV